MAGPYPLIPDDIQQKIVTNMHIGASNSIQKFVNGKPVQAPGGYVYGHISAPIATDFTFLPADNVNAAAARTCGYWASMWWALGLKTSTLIDVGTQVAQLMDDTIAAMGLPPVATKLFFNVFGINGM